MTATEATARGSEDEVDPPTIDDVFMSLSPLSPRTLADQTAEALRALIVSGQLSGGQRLVETMIAQQLQVSRGPVREAFRQLREEGLLRDVPRRGTYVVTLNSDDIRDILDLRVGLEARAARLIIQIEDAAVFLPLERALARLLEACRTPDAAAISAADYAFHERLCWASGSQRLHAVFVRYATEVRVLLRSDQERLYDDAGSDIAEQHRQLLAVLRAGDPDRAEEAFRRHVEEARDRLVRLPGSVPRSSDGRPGR